MSALNTEKTAMQYKVIAAYNPSTKGSLLRPVIVNRKTMNLRQIVAYAKNAGYVRGQSRDLEGLLGGFIQAIQDRALAGYSVNVNDWFIVSGRLKGTVGESRQLTGENSYHVTITATKDLKADIDDFSWSRVDEGAIIKLESLTSPGGNKGEVTRGLALVANGKNLAYNAAWGDKVTVSWVEGSETKSLDLTPSEVAETYMRFDWPSALAEVPENTELSVVAALHGEEGAAEQSSTVKAKLVGEVPEPALSVTGLHSDDRTDGKVAANPKKFVIEGTALGSLDKSAVAFKCMDDAVSIPATANWTFESNRIVIDSGDTTMPTGGAAGDTFTVTITPTGGEPVSYTTIIA